MERSIVKQARLSFKEGTSDKVYHVDLVRTADNSFDVKYEYGRRGKQLKSGSKVTRADEATAREVFDDLVAEKTSKGYSSYGPASDSGACKQAAPEEGSEVAGTASPLPQEVVVAPRAFLPMLATLPKDEDHRRAASRLDPKEWRGEVKLDGMRLVVQLRDGRVESMASRTDGEQKHRFPEVVSMLEQVLGGWSGVLDGEVGYLDTTGLKMHVSVLQHRPTTSEAEIREHARERPMTFVAFDILQANGRDLRLLPYSERRNVLQDLESLGLGIVRQGDPLALYDEVIAAGGEGIVAKRITGAYQGGVRSPDWLKAKAPTFRENLIVVGLLAGKGKRAKSFASFVLARESASGALEYVCTAGSGLSDVRLGAIMHALPTCRVDACPLPSEPRLEREVLAWIRPGAITADVKYDEPTKDAPRFPRVLRVVIHSEREHPERARAPGGAK